MDIENVKIKGATLEDIKESFDKLHQLAYESKKFFYKVGDDRYISPHELNRDRTLFTEIDKDEYDKYVASVNGMYPGDAGQLKDGDCVADVEFTDNGDVVKYWKFEPSKHGAEEVYVKAHEVYKTIDEFKEKYYGITE